jgi:hypothetical protein
VTASISHLSITIPERPWLEIPEEFRRARIREGRSFKSIILPARVRSPLVVNYGCGSDSTALLVLLVQAFEAGNEAAKPDLIIFADTGSEKRTTYDYLEPINHYLEVHGFPTVTVVAKADRGLKHASLHESCLSLETMPSLAYGGKSCSLKWKVAEMEHFLDRWAPAQEAWAAGKPVIKAIGYDASPADLRRSANPGDDWETFWYPLRDARLTRPDLTRIIEDAGLPQPGKSACFMCPASKRAEVARLLVTEPEKLATALKIEAAALLKTVSQGKLPTTIGLGRTWSWRAYLREDWAAKLVEIDRLYDAGEQQYLAYELRRQALEDAAVAGCEITEREEDA